MAVSEREISTLYELEKSERRNAELMHVNSQWDADYKELDDAFQQYRCDAQKAQSSKQAVIDKLKHQRDELKRELASLRDDQRDELKRELASLRDQLSKSHKKIHSLQKSGDYTKRIQEFEDEVALLMQQGYVSRSLGDKLPPLDPFVEIDKEPRSRIPHPHIRHTNGYTATTTTTRVLPSMQYSNRATDSRWSANIAPAGLLARGEFPQPPHPTTTVNGYYPHPPPISCPPLLLLVHVLRASKGEGSLLEDSQLKGLEKSIHLLRNLQLMLKVRLIMRLLITKLINAKLVLLLVYSLATVVSLLRALRSGWGPPLELALSLSNDNYWQVFVDVFADLLACVWSNPDTQHALLGIFCTLFAVSFLMNGLLIYTLVNGNSATQNSSCYKKSNPSQVELCTAVSSRHELHQALAEVGDWYGLCLGLEISDSISQPLRHSSKDVTDKKRVCLDAFYDLGEGEACWERVVRVVTGYPIHKRGLAKKLAKKFGIDFEDAVTRRNEL